MEFYTTSVPNVTPVKLITAHATYGIGFLTAFVGGFCSLFGLPNNMFTDKLERAEALAMVKLEETAKSVRADGVMDVRCQVDGLTFLISGTAYKLSSEEKAKRDAEKKTNLSKQKEPTPNWLKKSTPNTPPSLAKRCPYCGEIVKSNICEMCGKEVNF